MTISRLALIIAVLCFAIALLLAAGIVTGSHAEAWQDGGLFALALSFLAP